MHWDPKTKDWEVSEDNKCRSPYKEIATDNIYHIMGADELFTYCLKLVESSEKAGVYLTSMFNNKTLKEEHWENVYSASLRLKLKYLEIYKFEGFEKLEASDFPLIAKDVSSNTILIRSMK